MLVWPAKDPDETARREIDWSKHPSWQERDTITASSFSLSTAAGMSIASDDNDGSHKSWAFLTGGTSGSVGKVLAEATTEGGQTLQITATILIEDA